MTAINLKQEGDDLYKQKKYSEAISKYTNCIEKCSNPAMYDIHLAYSNRCACYMQTFQLDKALDDAEMCISLKPTWPKGYSRKAACLELLGRNSEAILCYEKVLQYDRSNIEATSAISRLSRSSSRTSSSTPNTQQQQRYTSTGTGNNSFTDNIRNYNWRGMLTSILDYLTALYYQCMSWWQDLSPNTRLYIQCGLLVAFLYYWFFLPSSSYPYYDAGSYSGGGGYGYGYGGYGGGYGGYGGGMSWTTWGLIMLAAYKLPPMLPDLLGEQYARPFFGMSWTTFMWLLQMFTRNSGMMGGFGRPYGGGYGYGGGMPGGMFGQRRRY